MRTIVAGSRNILNYETVKSAIEYCGWTVTEVVSGTAKGVDTLGERWARENHRPIKRFKADWKDIWGRPDNQIKSNQWGKYWKNAGIVRNIEMRDYAQALVAVWDGKSNGTRHMIESAKKKNLKVYVLEI